MILLAHMLFGAIMGSVIKNIPLAMIMALLGHYFLDAFPHVEYSIYNIRNKNWKKSLPDMAKVFFDFCLGVLCIFIFSKNLPIIYISAFAAIIPDGLTIVSDNFPKLKNSGLQRLFSNINKILSLHHTMHTEKIHYLTKKKKFPMFWRILTQAVAITASIIILTF